MVYEIVNKQGKNKLYFSKRVASTAIKPKKLTAEEVKQQARILYCKRITKTTTIGEFFRLWERDGVAMCDDSYYR